MPKPMWIRVHEAEVMKFNLPGGEVYGMVQTTTRQAWTLSQVYAPKRTGRLMRGIQYDRPKVTGPYTNVGVVRSTAWHSLFVIEGTTGPIRSSRPGGWMLIEGIWPIREVKGQAANNFMARALAVALRMKR